MPISTARHRTEGGRLSGRVTGADAHDLSAEAHIGQHIRPQPDGCWLYKGKLDQYVNIYTNGRTMPLHRWVYETMVGPIPDGCDLHHECEQPACCNPEHLTPLLPEDHHDRHRRRKPRLPTW